MKRRRAATSVDERRQASPTADQLDAGEQDRSRESRRRAAAFPARAFYGERSAPRARALCLSRVRLAANKRVGRAYCSRDKTRAIAAALQLWSRSAFGRRCAIGASESGESRLSSENEDWRAPAARSPLNARGRVACCLAARAIACLRCVVAPHCTTSVVADAYATIGDQRRRARSRQFLMLPRRSPPKLVCGGRENARARLRSPSRSRTQRTSSFAPTRRRRGVDAALLAAARRCSRAFNLRAYRGVLFEHSPPPHFIGPSRERGAQFSTAARASAAKSCPKFIAAIAAIAAVAAGNNNKDQEWRRHTRRVVNSSHAFVVAAAA